jgi:hypothetical protein
MAEIWKWIQKQNIGLPSRFVSSMTYVLDLKKVILFGEGKEHRKASDLLEYLRIPDLHTDLFSFKVKACSN